MQKAQQGSSAVRTKTVSSNQPVHIIKTHRKNIIMFTSEKGEPATNGAAQLTLVWRPRAIARGVARVCLKLLNTPRTVILRPRRTWCAPPRQSRGRTTHCEERSIETVEGQQTQERTQVAASYQKPSCVETATITRCSAKSTARERRGQNKNCVF